MRPQSQQAPESRPSSLARSSNSFPHLSISIWPQHGVRDHLSKLFRSIGRMDTMSDVHHLRRPCTPWGDSGWCTHLRYRPSPCTGSKWPSTEVLCRPHLRGDTVTHRRRTGSPSAPRYKTVCSITARLNRKLPMSTCRRPRDDAQDFSLADLLRVVPRAAHTFVARRSCMGALDSCGAATNWAVAMPSHCWCRCAHRYTSSTCSTMHDHVAPACDRRSRLRGIMRACPGTGALGAR